MTTFLNLGAGRCILPTTRENPLIDHIREVLDKSCPEAFDMAAKWINVDRIATPGINERFDLFAYPWVRASNGSPFSDNSIDAILCSHIIEHIPHEAKLAVGASMFPDLVKVAAHDGWWAFFYEAWRILKPGGMMHIVAPYAFSVGAMADPTHCRYVVPGSFSYFKPNPAAPFEYDLPMQFDIVDQPEFKILESAMGLARSLTDLDSAIRDMSPSEPGYDALVEGHKRQEDKLYSQMFDHVNVIETFSVTLKAIKEPV